MSKKRNRKSKNTNRSKQCRCEDRHHILWMRRAWAKGTYTNKLRNHWYMIIPIPKCTLHAFIHQQVHCIPVPRDISARDALEQLMLLESYGAIHETDNIERRLIVISALFDYCEPATHDALQRQLEAVKEYYKK